MIQLVTGRTARSGSKVLERLETCILKQKTSVDAQFTPSEFIRIGDDEHRISSRSALTSIAGITAWKEL
jgi:hypothetical protein